jgi:integrase
LTIAGDNELFPFFSFFRCISKIPQQLRKNRTDIKQLRTVTEVRVIVDFKKWRAGGAITWMGVDLILSTGMSVSEAAFLQIQDMDLKRGLLKITRLKRKKGIENRWLSVRI